MATAAPSTDAGVMATAQGGDTNDLTTIATEGSSSSGARLPTYSPPGVQPQHPNPNHPANHRRADWGGNPLAHYWSAQSGGLTGPMEAQFAPGYAKLVPPTKFANAAPLGLSGFALTTFVLSLVNLNTRGVITPNLVAAPALAYGGLIQLLAGMWEIANGNTFAAWALSSYGGFWISIGIIFTPGGFEIAQAYGGETYDFYTVLGLYILGWFIFTFVVWLATLRSTLVFSSLIASVWLAFLCLGTGYLYNSGSPGSMEMAMPNKRLINAGGGFGIIAAFLAWWVMFEGIIEKGSNSFFAVPSLRFPWAPHDRPPGFMDADLEALEKEA